jgi:hypothetical protein
MILKVVKTQMVYIGTAERLKQAKQVLCHEGGGRQKMARENSIRRFICAFEGV